MRRAARLVLPAWLLLLAAAAWLTFHRLPVGTDISAFLPNATGERQQLMMDQLQKGVASRILLIGLEGDAPGRLAALDRALVGRLKRDPRFAYVNNGDADLAAADRALLESRRYLLSDAVRPGHFGADALRARLREDVALLGSAGGEAAAGLLPADPTGETMHILQPLLGGGPASYDGLWFSADNRTALVMAQTAASGFDLARQQEAAAAVRRALAACGAAPNVRLLMTGPGVFAVQSQQVIESESRWLSALTALIVLAILYAAWRSPRVILLSFLPALTGLVAGVAAVRLAFGSVHGITLGFAAILIGEAVDYPSYLFSHVRPGESAPEALRRILPTLRMAVLTTVCGVAAMLLSSFQGLMQLGLLAAAGVLVAGVATRTLLPALLPSRYVPPPMPGWPLRWPEALQRLPARRPLAALLAAAAVCVLAVSDGLLDDDLAHMNPLPAAAGQLDQRLRQAMNAPDTRFLLVLRAPDREAALERSEALQPALDAWTARGLISGYDLAARWLPSERAQRARRSALPEPARLAADLRAAMAGLPWRDGAFAPFLADVERARGGPLLRPSDLDGTGLQVKVQTLLYPARRGWAALVPLSGVADPSRLAAAARDALPAGAFLLDLKTESARMMDAYLAETLRLTALGVVLIALVLAAGLRRARGVLAVLAPVLAACCADAALLHLAGERLSVFHLIALLLVVGVGINYALFFNLRGRETAGEDRTALSLAVCSMTALAAFAVLACSRTPVLHAIGLTVSLGVVLSLLLSALTARAPDKAPPP